MKNKKRRILLLNFQDANIVDACLCQNLAHAPKNMTISHSPFAVWKTSNFSFFLFSFFLNLWTGKKPLTFNNNFPWEKKKILKIDLTKNMINVNPKNEEKRLMSLWVWLVSDETCNLLEFLAYFCYYS